MTVGREHEPAAPQPPGREVDAAAGAVTGAGTAGGSSAGQRGPIRRVAGLAAVIVVVLALPWVAGYLVAGATAAVAAAVGALMSFLLSTATGTRRGIRLFPLLLAAVAASALLADTWWWVAVLTAIGAGAGLAVRVGQFLPLVICGIVFSAVAPPAETRIGWIALACYALGAVHGWGMARAIGAPASVAEPRLPWDRAVRASVGLGLAAGTAGTIMLLWGGQFAYWLPLTVFILAIPRPGLGLAGAAVQRVAGTAAGALLAGGAVLLEPPPAALLLIGGVALVAALSIRSPFWLSSALAAVGVVLILTPPGAGVEVADTRVLATVVAAALMGGLALLDMWWRRTHPDTAAGTQIRNSVAELTGSDPGGAAEPEQR
jgi:hypothetical protein